MTHKMRLVAEAFNDMVSGVKTKEYRVNDEKRQLINIGDEIVFSLVDDESKKIIVEVTDLKKYNSFYQQFANESNSEETIRSLTRLMYNFYSKEEEAKYGALTIYIKIKNIIL